MSDGNSNEKQGVSTRGVRLQTLDLLAGKGRQKPVARISSDDSGSNSDSDSDSDSESNIEVNDSNSLRGDDDCRIEETETTEKVEKPIGEKQKKDIEIECLSVLVKSSETVDPGQKSGKGIKRFFATKVVKDGDNAEVKVREEEDLREKNEIEVKLKRKAQKSLALMAVVIKSCLLILTQTPALRRENR